MDPPPPEAAAAAGSSCCGEEMCAERSETVGDGGICGERRGLGLEFCGVETGAPAASWSGCAGDAEAATGGGSAMAGGCRVSAAVVGRGRDDAVASGAGAGQVRVRVGQLTCARSLFGG